MKRNRHKPSNKTTYFNLKFVYSVLYNVFFWNENILNINNLNPYSKQVKLTTKTHFLNISNVFLQTLERLICKRMLLMSLLCYFSNRNIILWKWKRIKHKHLKSKAKLYSITYKNVILQKCKHMFSNTKTSYT